MESVLKTHDLTKQYKNQFAVDNVNMNINRGDIYGFIGKNGAGKTTVIRLITGLISETKGSFDLFGVSDKSDEISSARRRISGIVETPSVYLNMNAYDNLLMQCKILGIIDTSCIDVILDLVGLEYMKDNKKKAKDFSLGMKQRLGIGISLISNPDFIILDEPMNGLDPEGIIEVRELLLSLNREKNITILISSHILGELSKVATKYGFIDQGKLIQEISASDLDARCQKCLEVTVSSTDGLSNVLERNL
jgi:ABC-2 type transport system ATP-binding protein